MGCCWKHVIRYLFSLLMHCKLYLILFVVFPWLFVILELELWLLWLNALLFYIYLMILCSDLTGFALATPILIGRPVLYQLKYLVDTFSWLVYLVILLFMFNLLLWTLFAMRLMIVQLLALHLSIQLSLLIPWGHVVLLLVGSLGMPRLTIGIICVLILLMYLNHHHYYKNMKLITGLNYCQVVSNQVNNNIGCRYQS